MGRAGSVLPGHDWVGDIAVGHQLLGQTAIAVPAYVTDLSNDNKLAGLADNVFFGQVTDKSGQSRVKGLPETQFIVTVLENLKGDLSGTVTVNQQGGRQTNGTKFRVQGDPDLLEPGKSYLLVTRSNTAGDRHTNAPGFGRTSGWMFPTTPRAARCCPAMMPTNSASGSPKQWRAKLPTIRPLTDPRSN